MSIKRSIPSFKSLPIIFIFLLTIIFFSPVIFQGKTFYAFDTLFQSLPWAATGTDIKAHNSLITDPVNIFYPQRHFVKQCFDSGTIPLWQNYNFSGMPTSPPAHPIIALFLFFFPVSIAHDLLLWIHLLGAGFFMVLYLRTIGLSPIPGLIGAITWMFNAYVMVWFEFENAGLMAATLPFALYYFELWLKTRLLLYSLCITLALGLSITIGNAQLMVYQFIFFLFYFFYRYVRIRRYKGGLRISKRQLFSLCLPILILVCISSNLLISTFSILGGGTQRQGFSFKEIGQKTGELPDIYLTTLIFPDFFGSPAGKKICFTPRSKGRQPYNNYNELCMYCGILSLFLALACVPVLGRRKYALFYLITAIITLLMAMGSIFYYPLWKFVPGLSLSTPTRILYVFGFALSVLAALGAHILMTEGDKNKRVIILLWSFLLGIAVVIAALVQTESGIRWITGPIGWTDWDKVYGILKDHFALSSPVIWKPLILVVISFTILTLILYSKDSKTKIVLVFICIAVLSFDLMSFGLYYNTSSPRDLEYPETDAIRFLKRDKSLFRIATYGKFMHNTFAPFGLQDAGGYSSFYPKRYAEFLHLSQNGPNVAFPDNFSRWVNLKNFGSPLLDLINIKYLLLPPSASVKSPKLKLVYNREIKIYENKGVLPRVFFVPVYQFCMDQKEAYKAIGTYSLSDFRRKVVLEDLPPDDFLLVNNSNATPQANIKKIVYKPARIVMNVATDQKGFLVLSGNYHPSWRAKVDGKQTQILRANYIMRAIPLRPGEHEIELSFYPKLQISGVIVTAAGFLGLTALILVLLLAKRNE